MALQKLDLESMPLGTEIPVGPLLRNLNPEAQVILKMIEHQKSKTIFSATYAGVYLGEVYYTAVDQVWRASWR